MEGQQFSIGRYTHNVAHVVPALRSEVGAGWDASCVRLWAYSGCPMSCVLFALCFSPGGRYSRSLLGYEFCLHSDLNLPV